METLKNPKQAVKVLWINANAIVPDGKLELRSFILDRYMHTGRFVAVEFDSVADQVLEKLNKLSSIRIKDRKFVMRYVCVAFLD
jgi:hypothetical protein